MSRTRIEWADATWNPVTGCAPCSPGCQHCYAERMAKLLQAMGAAKYRDGFNVTCHSDCLDDPLGWIAPRVIFPCSMSDLFHPGVPFDFIDGVIARVAMSQQHRFLILTKRVDRMLEYWQTRTPMDQSARVDRLPQWYHVVTAWLDDGAGDHRRRWERCHAAMEGLDLHAAIPNLGLGVTVCNQPEADRGIPLLLQTPAAMRFVSVEPMLGPVDLRRWLDPLAHLDRCYREQIDNGMFNPYQVRALHRRTLDWVICGCESGPGRRPMDLDWVRSLRDQCCAAGVPLFLKQAEIDGKLVHMPALDETVWDERPEWFGTTP